MIDERIAIVTGGSRGIGRAIALELAAAAYRVVIAYKSSEASADETVQLIQTAGGDAEKIRFDIADPAESSAAMEDLVSRYKDIRALVNNAGINADGLFMLMPEKDWHSVIQTTLDGFYHVTKPVIKNMVRRRRGSVVSISSASALMGNRGQANYAAAKAGLIGASRSLAAEVARLGIRVNIVAPGLIETEMIAEAPVEKIKELIPMARIGDRRKSLGLSASSAPMMHPISRDR